MTTAMDKLLDAVEWEAVQQPLTYDDPDKLPYATHRGILRVAGHDFECFQLNTGQRIISEQSIVEFFSSFGG